MLWLVLAALLIVAAVKGRMPVWAALGLVVLLPLSCGAVWMASDAVGHGDASAFWVAALLPPLFALYALWARLPALHARLHAGVVSAVLGGAIVLLTAAPYVALTRAALPDPRATPGWPSSPRSRRKSGRRNSRPRATATRPSSQGWVRTQPSRAT